MTRQNVSGFELTKEGKQAISDFCVRKSMHKKDAVARLIQWFSAQPPVVQSVVVGLIDDDLRAAAAGVLDHLASELRSKGDKSTQRKSGGQ